MTGDDLPYVRVFRGIIADYYDGVVDDEGMMNAMGLLSRDDVATSLGMDAVDMGSWIRTRNHATGLHVRRRRRIPVRCRSIRVGRDG